MEWKQKFPEENIYWQTKNGILYNGDSLEILKTFPDESVDMVITSPPYWGLRFYGNSTYKIWDGDKNCEHEWIWDGDKKLNLQDDNPEFQREWREEATAVYSSAFCKKCGAWYGQLGLEPDFNMYLEHLWQIFDEVYRVLKPTGTLWVNLGDCYLQRKTRTNRTGLSTSKLRSPKNNKKRMELKVNNDVPQTSLCLIPERFAIGMIERKWILRNKIVWHRSNSMPESVKTRFTKSYEFIYFFVKNKKYYFKQIKEPNQDTYNGKRGKVTRRNKKQSAMRSEGYFDYYGRGRNKRDVWSIPTKGFTAKKYGIDNVEHFAVYPEELIEIPIIAGSPEYIENTKEKGIVLDPFMGSGTTAVVATKLGRNWIGIELNKDYCELIKARVTQDANVLVFSHKK